MRYSSTTFFTLHPEEDLVIHGCAGHPRGTQRNQQRPSLHCRVLRDTASRTRKRIRIGNQWWRGVQGKWEKWTRLGKKRGEHFCMANPPTLWSQQACEIWGGHDPTTPPPLPQRPLCRIPKSCSRGATCSPNVPKLTPNGTFWGSLWETFFTQT